MSAYKGDFDNWADVCGRFNITLKEPTEVILAAYNIDGYEGYAAVLFRQGRKYGLVYGSHCSCYGLEDQWVPEWYGKRELKKIMEERLPYHLAPYKEDVLRKLG